MVFVKIYKISSVLLFTMVLISMTSGAFAAEEKMSIPCPEYTNVYADVNETFTFRGSDYLNPIYDPQYVELVNKTIESKSPEHPGMNSVLYKFKALKPGVTTICVPINLFSPVPLDANPVIDIRNYFYDHYRVTISP